MDYGQVMAERMQIEGIMRQIRIIDEKLSFVWEEGKGLVEYKSGYKQEADILYIENIKIQEE